VSRRRFERFCSAAEIPIILIAIARESCTIAGYFIARLARSVHLKGSQMPSLDLPNRPAAESTSPGIERPDNGGVPPPNTRYPSTPVKTRRPGQPADSFLVLSHR
jgi:hypothetical protein